MIQTREHIIDQAQDIIGNTSSLLEAKLESHIKHLYERIAKIAVPTMLIKKKDFTVTASAQEKSLGSDVLGILTIYDTTNGYALTETDRERDELNGIDTTNDTGHPVKYADIGEHFVDLEVAAAGTMSIASSNNVVDITPNIVRIQGLSSSVMVAENITVTGTTAATGSISWDANQKLIINTGTSNSTAKTLAGIITCTRGVVVAKIAPNDYASLYRWISFMPIPHTAAASNTYRLLYLQRPLPLINDNDVPVFDCSDALINGLVAYGMTEDGQDDLAQLWDQKFNQSVSELIAHHTKKSNKVEQFMPGGVSSGSNLDSRISGSYTNPIGRW